MLKAPADGETLLINTSAHAYSAVAVADLPYDPLSDFVAVAPLTSQAYVLVAGAATGFGSLTELIAAAKAAPGSLRFGSTGVGTATHIGTEELNRAAGPIDAGDLVALGITTAQPSPALPNVPTLADAGAPGYDFPIWYGAWAHAATPPAIVKRRADDIAAAISRPGVRDVLAGHGMLPMNLTSDEFARFVIDETRRATQIIPAPRPA